MKNIFIAIIVIVMLPLLFASLSEKDKQELKGFSERDIQYIESIGFVDNLDGSWTITLASLIPSVVGYTFDYQPFTNEYGYISMMTVLGNNSLRMQLPGGYRIDKVGGTMIIWGGDVS